MKSGNATQRSPVSRPAPEPIEPQHGAPGIAVTTVTSERQFAMLAADWNRLHESAGAASVFNSWIWQYNWWQVYGAAQRLRILVAMEADRIVGILPAYVHDTAVSRVPLRLCRFIGTGGDTYPDDLGPLLAAGCEERAADALARAAVRWSDVDMLLFTDINPETAFTSALARAAAAAGRVFAQDVAERISFIRLPATWPAFLSSIDSKRRYRLRGMRNKLDAEFANRFFVWTDAADIDRAVDQLAALHRKRWKYTGGSDSFTTTQYIEFHRRIIKAFLHRGWLRLYCLEIEGELAAIYYAYRFRNTVYLMQTGFDPERRKSSPGSVLLGRALEHAIAEGSDVFDFLRGEYHYKNELANGLRETVFAAVYRTTLPAALHRLRRISLPLLKARLLRRPPPKLLP